MSITYLSGGPNYPDRHPRAGGRHGGLARCDPHDTPRRPASRRPPQKIDEAYTAKIKEYLQDPRDHDRAGRPPAGLRDGPHAAHVHGRIVGTPGELTYAKDIQRYYAALDKASDRAKIWTIGKTEEGRDMVVLADCRRGHDREARRVSRQARRSSPTRATTEAQAQELLKTAKPIYWLTSGMHSTETGGPEMLMELAYRLSVKRRRSSENIRKNVITFITPVIEVDGREQQVDTYYYNKSERRTTPACR